MKRISRIIQKLDILKPQYLKIFDESHLHATHIESALESHFRIQISSDCFKGKTRLEQHLLINNILKEEFSSGLHALSIEIK